MSDLQEQIRKHLAKKVAERLSEQFLEEHTEWLQEVTTDVCDEELKGLVDQEADEYYELMLEVAGSISIVAN